MTPQEMFVVRLRRHRERYGVPLADIATEANIKLELLEGLEKGDLSGWPLGLYARAWVRAYASAIGVDPLDTVDEFCRLFPNGDRRAHRTMTQMATIIASEPGYRDEFSHVEERRGGGAMPRINVMATPKWKEQVVRIVRIVQAFARYGRSGAAASMK